MREAENEAEPSDLTGEEAELREADKMEPADPTGATKVVIFNAILREGETGEEAEMREAEKQMEPADRTGGTKVVIFMAILREAEEGMRR